MMKRLIPFILVVCVAGNLFGQRYHGFRLTTQAGISTPFAGYASKTSDFSDPEVYLTQGADRGIDFNLNGELFLSEKFGLIVRLGYSLHEIDEQDLKSRISTSFSNDDEPSSLSLTTSPYQNLYLSGGFGYSIFLITDRFDIQPYVLGGVNIMRSAAKDYDFSGDQEEQLRTFRSESSVSPGLIVMPGINLNLRLMPFLELRVYGEVVGADHEAEVDVETVQGNVTTEFNDEPVEYEVRYFNTGAALSFRF